MRNALTERPAGQPINPGDRELLRSYVRRSDESAFRELVSRYAPMVQSVAMRCLDDLDLVNEVSQNTFALLARKAPRLASEVTISGWLFRAARFEALRIQRNEATRNRKMKEYAETAETDGLTDDVESRLREPLDEALAKLSTGDRNALLLRFYEQLNFRQLGEKLGKSEAAAQKQVERGLNKLRLRLQRQGFSATGAAISTALAAQFQPAARATSLTALTQSALTLTPSASVGKGVLHSLITMSTKSSLKIGVGLLLTLTGIVIWQAADLHASKREISALELKLQSASTPPPFAQNVGSTLPEAATAPVEPVPAQAEIPPIVIPTSAEEGMQLFVRYKAREFASHQRYANKVLIPGTPEREAYEMEKQQLLAGMSSLMVAQPMLTGVWEDRDPDLTVRAFGAGYRELFSLPPSDYEKLEQITREALEAKRSSREEFPQGTPEAVDSEKALQKTMLDQVAEVLTEEQFEEFVGVFGRQPITQVSFNMPVVFDSKEQRDRIKRQVTSKQ